MKKIFILIAVLFLGVLILYLNAEKPSHFIHYKKLIKQLDVNQYTRNYKLLSKQSISKDRYNEKELDYFKNFIKECPEFLTNVLFLFEKEKFPDNQEHQEKYKVDKQRLKNELFCYQQIKIAIRNIPLKYIHKDLF